ncbi:MAG: winged helix DNA-binding domain-containing protein [Firmicutes bacterium]|uniref:Winged helix DNA-binding domain-containing protein n=1 Tax=Melghirimyces thermohalophilus TaxID=1236220 RepID=A0A1G6PRC2_9BACL|nr:crosslink repair DNA glycosylase YcaQ family protein [Melghirimyces thermohalophilus]MDA8352307.1 winged helix DNA-binding domain-containing protein [Bacillota bacterium]SDC81907.1 Winged helix DNA-binding domain-containing protein [Melghirimyces thermohalophilus]
MIQVAGRKGSERYFDLTEQVVPDMVWRRAKEIDPTKAKEALLEKYMRAYRVFEPSDSRFGWLCLSVAERRQAISGSLERGDGVQLAIEGICRSYFILAEDLDSLRSHVPRSNRECTPEENPIRFLHLWTTCWATGTDRRPVQLPLPMGNLCTDKQTAHADPGRRSVDRPGRSPTGQKTRAAHHPLVAAGT